MTKVFEEILRGPLPAVRAALTAERQRGEFTLVVAGCGRTVVDEAESDDEEIERRLRGDAAGIRSIAAELAAAWGLPFRRVYRRCLAKKGQLERAGSEPGL